MSLFNALILGLIQGVAEFLPISSSGHLAIAQELLGFGVEGSDDYTRFACYPGGGVRGLLGRHQGDDPGVYPHHPGRVPRRDAGENPPRPANDPAGVVGTLPLFLVLPIQDFVEGLSSNTYFNWSGAAGHRCAALGVRPG